MSPFLRRPRIVSRRKVKEHKWMFHPEYRKEKQCEYCDMKYKIGATRFVVWLQGSYSKCAYFDLIDVRLLHITTKCAVLLFSSGELVAS